MYLDDLFILGIYVDYYFENNDIEGVKKMLEVFVVVNFDNGCVNFMLVEIYLCDNQFDKVYGLLKKFFQLQEIGIDVKMQVLLKIYDFQVQVVLEVFEFGEELVCVYFNDVKLWFLLGDLYIKNDDEVKVLIMYEKVLEFE